MKCYKTNVSTNSIYFGILKEKINMSTTAGVPNTYIPTFHMSTRIKANNVIFEAL